MARLSRGILDRVILVDKMLISAKPADLQIEQPTKFELALNPKTAKLIGREIPRTLLAPIFG
jgi:putative ABC transport system substrate-binding protein